MNPGKCKTDKQECSSCLVAYFEYTNVPNLQTSTIFKYTYFLTVNFWAVRSPSPYATQEVSALVTIGLSDTVAS